MLSVSQRIFAVRVKLMLALQDVANQSIPWRADYRRRLDALVGGMITRLCGWRARISVRKAMPCLDMFRSPGERQALTPEKVKRIQKVIDYLAEHCENPVIDKIRKLEPITAIDVLELERILWEELGTHEEYEAERHNSRIVTSSYRKSLPV